MRMIDEARKVVSDIKDYVNSLEKDNYVFGNIALSKEGENAVNIGSNLSLGKSYESVDKLKESLDEKNAIFGKNLNTLDCFSISKYLQISDLKCFELRLNRCEKELLLHKFKITNDPIRLEFKDGFVSFKGVNPDLVPHYTDDYKPNTDREYDASVAFNKTIDFYTQFHKIVVARTNTPNDEGYIYLIRPSKLDEAFSALAYMYLKTKLCNKDIEIISYYLSSYFLELLKDKARKESVKSAKAAIMSRNLSHNLGSHVMSYLKQNFNSVQEIVANGTLETIIPHGDEDQIVNGKNISEEELPLLVGMGKFISYLQERQDYIATVSTDYIPCQSVVNFKDAIYDELNPDYRFYRHKDHWSGHKPANILLQNIAKSEGLSRELLPTKEGEDLQKENNILIQYRSFDGLKEEDVSDFENMRKWNFSLPGGIMGRQAVFSIVENIIRNSAKHGSRQQGENLKITFDIQDADDELDPEYSNAVDKSDLYIVTLTDNVKTTDIDNIIDNINVVINTSFYEVGADLTASNKGIKEMIVSAAWLRGVRIEEQNEGEKIAPILKARKSTDGFLQYVFCLPKVKKMAYLTNDKNILERNTKELNRLGWYLFDIDKYKNLSNRCFNFILLDQSLSEQREEIRKCSNNRLFVVSDMPNHERREIEFKIDSVLNHIASLENGEDREKYLKEIETALFAQMALTRNDESARIAISDGNTNEIKSDKVRLFGKESNITGEKYIYRTHNDSTADFLGFLNTLKKGGADLKIALDGIEFIEGITGGNSTDRIVRREVKDDLWVYQQIHAMKIRIAVFDERIFTRITGYETSKLKEVKTEPIDWKKELQGLNVDAAKEMVDTYDFERKQLIDSCVFYDDAFSKEKVIEFAQKAYPFLDSVGMDVDRVLPLVCHKKGIDVYTLTKIQDENNCFAVWAVRDNVDDIVTDTRDDRYKNNIYGRIEKVAELYFENYTPKIKFLTPAALGNEFKHYDYVTIHQGLLDKIYQKMPITDSKDETQIRDNTVSAKRAVTKEISDKFIKGECNSDNYLPGLIIHSGRSKPNTKDMPQNQPFVQYSAVENAIMDCKYTLVELLDFANYD